MDLDDSREELHSPVVVTAVALNQRLKRGDFSNFSTADACFTRQTLYIVFLDFSPFKGKLSPSPKNFLLALRAVPKSKNFRKGGFCSKLWWCAERQDSVTGHGRAKCLEVWV